MRTIATLLIVLLLAPAALAEDAKSVFDSLFAAKIKAAGASADRADDVALAKDMVALAKTSTNQPGLVALLCDAAYDLGSRHADGFGAAAEAMTLLAETVEAQRPAARDKLITILTRQSTLGKPDDREPAGEALVDLLLTIGDEKVEAKQYAEAVNDYRRAVAVATQKKSASLDEAKAKLEFAVMRDRTMKQLARLQEKLLKDADPATAEEIVKLYVIELDDPESAKGYLNRVKDETLKTLVPLAAKAVEEVSEEEALRLGEWYNGRVKEANAGHIEMPLRRAKLYLARFLEMHSTSDLARTKAVALLKEVNASLTAAGATATGAQSISRTRLLSESVLLLTFDKRTFEKSNSAIRDLSKGRREGAVTNVEITEGRNGEAARFAARDSHIQFTDEWDFSKGLTIAAWVKFDDFNNGYPFIVSGDGNQIAFLAMGSEYPDHQRQCAQFYLTGDGPGAVRGATRIKTGEWTFVACVYQGRELRIITNEEVVTRKVNHDIQVPIIRTLRIGANRLNGQTTLHGAIDDLAIFKRALTPDEIKALCGVSK